MKYHAATKGFIIDQQALEFIALSIPYIIKHIRIGAGLPLDKYARPSAPLEPADYAMRGLLEIADRIGIDLGARWGEDLDVRDAG